MTPLQLILAGIACLAGGGVAALVVDGRPRTAGRIAVAAAVAGGALALTGALAALSLGVDESAATRWPVPGGVANVGVDPLTAFFLIPLLVLGPLAAVFGHTYLPSARVAAGFDLLLAAVALVLIARHVLVFLLGWEVMTVLAFLLVTVDHADPAVRRAGWVYLIASHVAVLALFATFLLLSGGGTLDFAGFGAAGVAPVLFAIVGFGIKAGFVGGHGWLPEAHAAAPSHVSAFMSGVLVKVGLYGLLRVLTVQPAPACLAALLVVLGLLGALVGVSLAFYQGDLKRVLAYSTVENMGIALAGVGLGAWGRATGNRELAVLGFTGGLLHVWNHTLMKGLMFLGAGSVVHGAGSRSLERLGGLLRRMPWTGAVWMLGAVAIAGLPPLNGFVSEFLLYRALAGSAGAAAPSDLVLVSIAGIGALALVGGLAAACFVRLIGVVLLGQPRSAAAAAAHESPRGMRVPTLLLALFCLGAALAPLPLVELLAPVVTLLSGVSETAAAARAVEPLVIANAALLAALVLFGLWLASRLRRATAGDTWGCGYAAPTARMQYGGGAFAEILTWRLLPRWLRPRQKLQAPDGLFPAEASRRTDHDDPLTRGLLEPFLARWGDRFARLRWMQRGSLHLYLLYIVVTAVVALLWMSARDRWWP